MRPEDKEDDYNEQEEIIIRKVILTMDEQKKYEVIKSLTDHPDGNKDRAAITLGCSKRHINRMLAGYKKYGKEFFVHGNKGRKYCSHQCYIADRFGEECGCCD